MLIGDWSSDVCSSDLAHADARRGAGRDDVARLEAHELGQVADEEGDAVDHGPGRAVLIALAVDLQPHRQHLRVGEDRKSAEKGKRVSVRVDLGGRRIIKKNNYE